MDEDQVNEEQGSNPERQEVTFKQAEQDDTPSKGMFSSVLRRDPVNLYSFLGKQNDDVNERINGIESQLVTLNNNNSCLLYTSPSPRDRTRSRMPSSA